MWLLNYICRSPRSPSLLMSQTFTITNPSPGIELLRRLTFKVEPPDWKEELDYFNYAAFAHRKWISAGRRLFHLDRETSTSGLARDTDARPGFQHCQLQLWYWWGSASSSQQRFEKYIQTDNIVIWQMRKKVISLLLWKYFDFYKYFHHKSVTVAADRSCLTVGPDISVHPIRSALTGEVGGWRGGEYRVVNSGLSWQTFSILI